ncbi:MAG: carbohydrate kinase family protein [Nocardioidaceae bacterium]
MHIATLGDVMLDILVDAPGGLLEDDDTEARIELTAGGQAANVAAWAVALGTRATLVGPRGDTASATFVAEQLGCAGVDLVEIAVPSTGKVVSIVSSGTRTLMSDAGDQSWVDRLNTRHAPTDVDWLHVSGYPLLRAADPSHLLAFVDHVRRGGASVSLDLSSAGLIDRYGPTRFVEVLRTLGAALIFGNLSEWEALGAGPDDLGTEGVVKRGGSGVTTVVPGVTTDHPARRADVVDLTGAGDALAAGYLVGGIELGLATAARCVGQRGAQPSRP